MKGGVTFFRSGSSDALRTYFFSSEAVNSDYYLEGTPEGHAERMIWTAETGLCTGQLSADGYAAWVEFSDPATGEIRGTVRANSVRFVEKNINVDKSLSLAAAVNPRIEVALNNAQRKAVEAMTSYVAEHARTRIGPAGAQRQVPVEHIETVTHAHAVSRENEPHPHIHWQVGARVWAEGKWRQLDTADFAKHSAALNALGEQAMHADPELRRVLAAEGYGFDPATGQVAELEPYVEGFSTRAAQVRGNKELLEANWRADPANVGKSPGPGLRSEWDYMAWNGTAELAHIDAELIPRPAKEPAEGDLKQRWTRELAAMGFQPPEPRTPHGPEATRQDWFLDRDVLAQSTLEKLAGTRSTWSGADIRAEATRALTASGLIGTPDELAAERDALVSAVVSHEEARSIADPRITAPETVRHWTSEAVIEAEDELKKSLAARAAAPADEQKITEAVEQAKELDPQLSEDQARAAALLGTGNRLSVIEGAAGAGKTKQLAVASALRGERSMLTVTPTLKAAQEVRSAGAEACSLHKLLHAHGFRWDENNQWTRLAPEQADPATGELFVPPVPGDEFYLHQDTQLVVDEAGMVDQEAACALLRLADAHRADVALIGDRAQLAAVGRGGVLDMAARTTTEHVDLDQVHRFDDAEYAELSLRLRDRRNISETFETLYARGDVRIHATAEDSRQAVAADAAADIQAGRSIALTVPTNDAAASLNRSIQTERLEAGQITAHPDPATGSDGLEIYTGDTVMTRSNNKELGVANRENFRVVTVHGDGALTIAGEDHRHHRIGADYVAEHVHLGYAVTDYGNQGTTVDHGAVLLEEGMSGGGAYVGATRGRESNTLHIVAEDTDAACEKFTQIMDTDRADRGLDQARRDFAEQIKGLDLHPTPPQHPDFQQWAENMPETIRAAAKEVRTHRLARDWPNRDAAFREKHGTDPKSARIKANGAHHRREEAEKTVQQTRARIMGEHEQQVGALVYSAVDTLRAAEADARDAGMFTRKNKTRQAHQLRAEVEQQLGVKLPGEDRVAQQPSTSEDLAVVRPMVHQKLTQTVRNHPDYQDAQHQVQEAKTAEHQAQQTVQTITEAHHTEVGPRTKYDPQKHRQAEQWYSHLNSHGIPASQITQADPQQQIALARWNQTEHHPYMDRVQAETAAATQPRRVRSIEEQLRDADPYNPGVTGPSKPDRSGPELGM